MSETKPQKRLVSKGKYVRVMGMQIGFYSLGMFLLMIGILFLISGILCASKFISLIKSEGMAFLPFGFGCFLCCVSFSCFNHGKHLLAKGKAIEPVKPITERNAHLLPAQETLLRGSVLPPTIQQAELLRATQTAQEIAQEELLRSTGKE